MPMLIQLSLSFVVGKLNQAFASKRWRNPSDVWNIYHSIANCLSAKGQQAAAVLPYRYSLWNCLSAVWNIYDSTGQKPCEAGQNHSATWNNVLAIRQEPTVAQVVSRLYRQIAMLETLKYSFLLR